MCSARGRHSRLPDGHPVVEARLSVNRTRCCCSSNAAARERLQQHRPPVSALQPFGDSKSGQATERPAMMIASILLFALRKLSDTILVLAGAR